MDFSRNRNFKPIRSNVTISYVPQSGILFPVPSSIPITHAEIRSYILERDSILRSLIDVARTTSISNLFQCLITLVKNTSKRLSDSCLTFLAFSFLPFSSKFSDNVSPRFSHQHPCCSRTGCFRFNTPDSYILIQALLSLPRVKVVYMDTKSKKRDKG